MTEQIDDREQFRAVAMQIAARAEADPEFREKIQADPGAVLADAGIPANLTASRELRPVWCADFTCWSSECPGTCYVSFY